MTWQQQYGAARRAHDRALLAGLERQIALEEAQTAKIARSQPAAFPEPLIDFHDEAGKRIAAVFGRPLK